MYRNLSFWILGDVIIMNIMFCYCLINYPSKCLIALVWHLVFNRSFFAAEVVLLVWVTYSRRLYVLGMVLLLLLILATSTWEFSELWGGEAPTSDIDHFIPMICRLLLHTLIEPSAYSPTVSWCPVSPAVFFCPASAQDHVTTQVSPVSVTAYQEFLSTSLPSPVTTIDRFFLYSFTLNTPARFLWPMLPRYCRSIF